MYLSIYLKKLLVVLFIVLPLQVYANSTLYDYSYSETNPVELFTIPKSQPLNVSYKGEKSSRSKTSHIVRRGDSIYKIAKRYGYSVKQLARWNGLKYPYKLKAGRRLRVAPLSSIRNTKKTNKNTSYIVRRGDNIYKIARRFGYSYKQLATWNGLKYPYRLKAGRRLRVAPLPWNRTKKSKIKIKPKKSVKSKTKSTTTQPKSSSNTKGYHKVRRGETLYSIARRYRTSVTNIIRWNRLSKPYNLSVGQILRVYYPSGARLGRNKGKTRTRTYSTNRRVSYHTVSQGETLYSIARRYRKSVSQIAITNKLKKPYYLYKGQILRINSTTSSKKRTHYHYVKRGENLKMIAAKYGLKPYVLAKQNGIGNPYTIYPGQRLSIRK